MGRRKPKPTTTAIRVLRETWHVPRGFGKDYRERAQMQLAILAQGHPGKVIDVIQDLLGLIGYRASRAEIAEWPLRKRVEAEAYAANVYMRASDNALRAHPRPEWWSEVWYEPEGGRRG